MNNLYENLEKERKNRKMIVEDFTHFLGISQWTYRSWKSDRVPSNRSLAKVHKALGWDLPPHLEEAHALFEKIDERREHLGITNKQIVSFMGVPLSRFYGWRYDLTAEGEEKIEDFLGMSDRDVMHHLRNNEIDSSVISADELRKKRLEKEWTQQKLAEKLNVISNTISKWENGKPIPKDYMPVLNQLFNRTIKRKSEDERKAEQEQRRRVLNLLDVKYDGQLSKAPEDCPLLNEFRELVGA